MGTPIRCIQVPCILLSLLLPGCGEAFTLPITERHPTWNSLGGLSIGKPQPKEGRVLIPVRVLDPAWLRNHVIQRIDWSLSGNQIQFSIVMDATGNEIGAASDRGILIDPLQAATYEIAYLDPDGTLHPCGSVTITTEGLPTERTARRVVYLAFPSIVIGCVLILWLGSSDYRKVTPEKTVAQLLEFVKEMRKRMPRGG
jgi:hypothetical protein